MDYATLHAEAKSSLVSKGNSSKGGSKKEAYDRLKFDCQQTRFSSDSKEEAVSWKPPTQLAQFTSCRDLNANYTDSSCYLRCPDTREGPSGGIGRVVDVSDRLLICASTNCRNEGVVYGTK